MTEPTCGCASPTRRTVPPPSTCSAAPCRRPTSRSVPRASVVDGRSRGWRRGSTISEASTCSRWRSPTRAGAPSAIGSATTDASIAYLSDHGPSALGPGPDGWGPYHDAALALADGVDLLVHDAQHTAARASGPGPLRSLGGRLRGAVGRAGPRRAGAVVPPRPQSHRRRGRCHRRPVHRGTNAGDGRHRGNRHRSLGARRRQRARGRRDPAPTMASCPTSSTTDPPPSAWACSAAATSAPPSSELIAAQRRRDRGPHRLRLEVARVAVRDLAKPRGAGHRPRPAHRRCPIGRRRSRRSTSWWR